MFTLTCEEPDTIVGTNEPCTPVLRVIRSPDGMKFFDTGADSVPIEDLVSLLNKAWNLAETRTLVRVREALDSVPICKSCRR